MQLEQKENKEKSLFSKTSVHVIILCIIALLLRLYKFRFQEVLISSDEVFLFEYAVKPVYAFFHPSLETIATELFRFFNFGWGWGNLFFGTLFFFFYKLFGIPFTEVTINLPYVFVGTGSVIIAYFLGKELHSSRYGFIAGLLIAILPSHISFSRSIGLNGISGLFCFLLTLYLFLRGFKTKKVAYFVAGYVSLAYYIFSENQAIGIIPILLYTSYVYTPLNSSISTRILYAIKQLFSPLGSFLFFLISLPVALAALYLTTKGLFLSSYLNLFHSKPIVVSFYFDYVLTSFIDDIGVPFTILLLVGFVSYFILLSIQKMSKTSTIFLIWFAIYTTPWLFLVVPTSYELRAYNTYTLCSLIFLSSYMINFLLTLPEKVTTHNIIKKLYMVLLFLLFLLFFLHSFFIVVSAVYREDYFGFSMPTPVFGYWKENNGIKTIGYYIREHLPADSVVFADVELFNAHFYFNRTIIADLDLSSEQIYSQLFSHFYPDLNSSERNVQFEYAFIQKKHFALLAPLLEQNGYGIIVITVNNNEEEIAYLYANTRKIKMDARPVILHIKEYDKLFNERYGTLDALYIDYG